MLISVIIPAYNCERFIQATIGSLVSQTYKEIEVIVINDGSTDKTLDILTKLQQSDNRIKVVTVPNGGPAVARNKGISLAMGEYLYFMDADDVIESTMLEDMQLLCAEENLDACACGYTMIDADSGHKTEFLFESFVARSEGEYRERLMPMIKAHLMYVVWNKLFKTSMIKENNITFLNYLSGEDRLFNTHTFCNIERFGFVNKPYYSYFLRGQASLANKYVENRFEAALKCHLELVWSYRNMGLYNTENKAYIDFIFIKGVMSCITQLNAKACPLTHKQKMVYIKGILELTWVQEAIGSVDDEFSYSKRIAKIFRTKNPTLIYLCSKAIFYLQFKFNKLYLKIKHNK